MHSLYDVLLKQHGRQLMPVRCAYSTIIQLHRYFEDVVLENNLSALVIESLPLPQSDLRAKGRAIRELAEDGRRAFFFVHQADTLKEMVTAMWAPSQSSRPSSFPRLTAQHVDEHFIVIADARFSALLATVRGRRQ